MSFRSEKRLNILEFDTNFHVRRVSSMRSWVVAAVQILPQQWIRNKLNAGGMNSENVYTIVYNYRNFNYFLVSFPRRKILKPRPQCCVKNARYTCHSAKCMHFCHINDFHVLEISRKTSLNCSKFIHRN